MIDNFHGDSDKTPLPFGSQYEMLHTIYSTRALPKNFRKMTFLKNWKKKVSRSWFNEQATYTPNTAGIQGALCGAW